MIIASSRRLQACFLSYLMHHKWSWNFAVKLCDLSHLPGAWCNMSWTWNLITVVFYCLSKVHYTQNTTSEVKGLYERLSLIFPGILPQVKFHKICWLFQSSDITKHVWGASPRLFWNCFAQSHTTTSQFVRELAVQMCSESTHSYKMRKSRTSHNVPQQPSKDLWACKIIKRGQSIFTKCSSEECLFVLHKSWKRAHNFFINLASGKLAKMHLDFTTKSFMFGHINGENLSRTFFFIFWHKNSGTNFHGGLWIRSSFIFWHKNRGTAPRTFL